MFHFDRGVQYVCDEFRPVLGECHIAQSLSRKRNCRDNAVAESFFKSMKIEELNKLGTIKESNLNSLIFNHIDG